MSKGLRSLYKFLNSIDIEYAYITYGGEIPGRIMLAQTSVGVEGAASYLDEYVFTDGRLYYRGKYEDTTVSIKYYSVRNATWVAKVGLETIDMAGFCGARGVTIVVYGDVGIAERLGKYLERRGIEVITPSPG